MVNAEGGVRLDPRRADAVIVQRIVQQERIVGVCLFDDALDVGEGEGAGILAVAGVARTPVAAECLLFEELLAVELDAKLILAKPSFERDAVAATAERESDRDDQRGKLT